MSGSFLVPIDLAAQLLTRAAALQVEDPAREALAAAARALLAAPAVHAAPVVPLRRIAP